MAAAQRLMQVLRILTFSFVLQAPYSVLRRRKCTRCDGDRIGKRERSETHKVMARKKESMQVDGGWGSGTRDSRSDRATGCSRHSTPYSHVPVERIVQIRYELIRLQCRRTHKRQRESCWKSMWAARTNLALPVKCGTETGVCIHTTHSLLLRACWAGENCPWD
jgi:hypothetical protein